jgi:hypothetical protein
MARVPPVIAVAIVCIILSAAFFGLHIWQVKRRGSVEYVITLDMSEFERAFEQLAEDLRAFGTTMGAQMLPAVRKMARGLRRLTLANSDLALAIAQNRHGLGNRVPETGAWRSDMCASWVHGRCPGLNCDCRCHR